MNLASAKRGLEKGALSSPTPNKSLLRQDTVPAIIYVGFINILSM